MSANTRDKEAQTRAAQTRTVLAGLDAKLSFFESELSQLDDAVLEEARANKEDALYIERLLEDKKTFIIKRRGSNSSCSWKYIRCWLPSVQRY